MHCKIATIDHALCEAGALSLLSPRETYHKHSMALLEDAQLLLHRALTGQNTWGTAILVFLLTLALLSIKGWWDAQQAAKRAEEGTKRCSRE